MGFLKNVWMRIERAYSTSEEEPAPPGVTPPATGDTALLSEEPESPASQAPGDPTDEDREYWRSDTR